MTAPTETAQAKRDDTAVVQHVTDHILGLIAKADNGNNAALAELRATLRETPALLKLLSGLAYAAEAALLDAIGLDKQPGARVVMEQQLDAMRRDLLGPDATPLERLLVQRLAADWLWCQYHDTRCAAKCQGSMTFKEGEYWQRGRERAQRALLRSARTLATVRRLLGPAVQVKLIDKQLNVTR